MLPQFNTEVLLLKAYSRWEFEDPGAHVPQGRVDSRPLKSTSLEVAE